jgi:magnesium-transporting ATPase (P-type)
VLQILALDIGTDLLPALALGAEPANPRTMTGRMRADGLISRSVTGRVFGVLGPAEAVVEMAAFIAVLLAGGWTWGAAPSSVLLAAASGTAFTAVVLGQAAAWRRMFWAAWPALSPANASARGPYLRRVRPGPVVHRFHAALRA